MVLSGERARALHFSQMNIIISNLKRNILETCYPHLLSVSTCTVFIMFTCMILFFSLTSTGNDDGRGLFLQFLHDLKISF